MRQRFIAAVIIAFAISQVQASRAQAVPAPSGPVVAPSVLDHLQPDHASIAVHDLDKERDWYMRVFGAKVSDHATNPNSEVLMMRLPGYRIDLVKSKAATNPAAVQPEASQYGWMHIVFNLPPAEVEQALQVLKARGTDAKPSTFAVQANERNKGKIWLLQLHDPEGNAIEIVAQGN